MRDRYKQFYSCLVECVLTFIIQFIFFLIKFINQYNLKKNHTFILYQITKYLIFYYHP